MTVTEREIEGVTAKITVGLCGRHIQPNCITGANNWHLYIYCIYIFVSEQSTMDTKPPKINEKLSYTATENIRNDVPAALSALPRIECFALSNMILYYLLVSLSLLLCDDHTTDFGKEATCMSGLQAVCDRTG